ncbi:small neutral amino acid transporter SnatA (MarC family) [Bradyrhizobium elkanii]
MLWNQFIGITMLLYALTNPVGAIPIFLAITRQAGSANIHRIIVLAGTAVAVFFVGAAVLGKEILGFFNVGLNDFRIAGWDARAGHRARDVSGPVWEIHTITQRSGQQ